MSEKQISAYDREGRNTSSNDPQMLDSRVFIGNLPSEKITRVEVEKLFSDYGNVLGVSLHKSYGFVQYDNKESAEKAVEAMHGYSLQNSSLDVNLAGDRHKEKSKSGEGEDKSRHHGKSSSSSSRHRHEDRHDRGRDRGRDRDRDRYRERPYRRERSRSPLMSPQEAEYRARLRHLERMRGYPPPPFRDPYVEPPGFFPPRDPYMRPPREDLFDVGRDPFPPSPLPPIRRRDPYGPPVDQFDRLPIPRDPIYDRLPVAGGPHPYSPPPPERRRGTEMEIIVVNNQQKEYGELIRDRVEGFGVLVDMIHLSPTVSLADALDAAANRGLLYAVIVTAQHEMHRSVTLTILHGRNPQEHKNMPLEDAMGLVSRDYEHYTIGVREGRILPRRPQQKNEISNLLSQAASGDKLTANQLQQVIDALQKKKHVNEPQLPQISPKEDIQRQQADLQAKILSLLGSNAVVPSSSNQTPSQGHSYEGTGRGVKYPPGRGYGGGGGGGGGAGGGGGGGNDGGGRGYGQGGFGY